MRSVRFVVVLALLAAMAGAPAQTPPRDQFVLGMAAETTTFYPPGTGGTYERNTFMQIFDPLLHREQDGTIVGRVASDWENVDPTTWRFSIRDGIEFSNGDVLDATTVAESIDLYRAPESVVASRYASIANVEVIDERTLDIHTVNPDPFLPNTLTDNGFILPTEHLAEVGIEAFATAPVGSGPYEFEEWVRGDRIVLRANENYWNGQVPIGEVVWRTIPEPSSRVAALQSGEVDLIWEIPPIQVAGLERVDDIEVQAIPSPRAVYIGLWPDSPVGGGEPLRDQRVRQALNYAVDRQAIVQALQRGYGTLISQPIPNAGYAGYNEDVEPYPYDPERARALLAEAGYPDGFEIDLLVTARYLSPEESQAIAANLAEVGVDVNIDTVEFGQYVTRLVQEQSHAPMYALSIQGTQGIDAYEIYSIAIASGASFNWNEYSNPDIDTLIAEMAVTFDDAERAELARQAGTLAHEDPPWIYLWNNSSIWGLNADWDWQARSDDLISVFDDVAW